MRSEPNPQTAVGRERTFTIVAFLVDTNVLVYRFDARYAEKQRIARDVLHRGLRDDSARIPHQALIEFVSVVTHTRVGSDPLLSLDEARHEVEELMTQFPILYPNAAVVHSALLGAAAYRISWFDAHLWAYAEHYGLEEIVSEDFEHGRLYGSVRIRNPFRRP
jgi:predicted nucleic acid-binding protein